MSSGGANTSRDCPTEFSLAVGKYRWEAETAAANALLLLLLLLLLGRGHRSANTNQLSASPESATSTGIRR